ncbi:hypothetical protein [Tsukamurella tyrosinosolvens]|uniref:hypothetical protein n=1 Tax=Tsukamurella tyrosinosolvens TaxID=57704 RepID=UPI0011C05D5D|nr:hypothetical protein [Tsukamurella tyrosinosolvens]
MTSSEYSEDGNVNVEIAWPYDSYKDARMISHFVFTIENDQGYIAFGEIPPLPGRTPLLPPARLPIPVVGAFTFRPGMLVQMRNTLNEFAERMPELFSEGNNAESESRPG